MEFEFEPGYDAFPDAGVFRETQTTLHPDYREVESELTRRCESPSRDIAVIVTGRSGRL